MIEQALIEILERQNSMICHNCVHPQTVGWCENHCKLPKAFATAIDAMRKQIPVKPVIGYTYPESFREMLKKHNSMDKIALSKAECCPVCGRRLDKSEFAKAMKGISYGPPYCRYCGQAIDWEGEG